jgi:ferric-dicitrate binding protein FerR (iron transport regulator)
MDKEYLIKKWLDHDLNAEELEAFKMLEEFESLTKLSQGLDNFKAPDFDEKHSLNRIAQHLKSNKQKSNWLKPILRIAAIVLIALGSFWFLNKSSDTITSTLAAQKITLDLPDASEVSINASSRLIYNKTNWKNNREVKLEGEAFFKVAKGSTFDVKTSDGVVRVFGTQFNVRQRDDYFEVICYEGLVGVFYSNHKQLKLKPGDRFLVLDGEVIVKPRVNTIQPDWILNESQFESMPYEYVLAEFERQYDVTFDTKSINLKQLFSGNFSHDNYHIAIKAITLPLNLTYSRNKNTITLKSE